MSNNPLKIFIVEDDLWYSKFLNHQIAMNPDYIVSVFHSAKDCIAALDQEPDIITLDYTLPDMNGADLLKKIKSISSETEVIIISGQEDIQTAIGLLRMGAYDYLMKNDDTKERIWNLINNIKANIGLKEEITHLKEEIVHKYDFETSIIGTSDSIKKIFGLIEKASKTQITVSVSGETGTGKELVAKSIHYNSSRKKQTFVAVNVSAIPKDLIESELFGHEKGSFTGSHARRIGKFEEASGGTLFLDEIGDFSLSLQSKLLRVLQEREITRVGGNEVIPVDVRIITATHKNLLEEVNKGNFREDLYYRLYGLPIVLPPLRERGGDILVIAKHFIKEFCKENKIRQKQISPEAREKLLAYHYPGNVRELKALIELAVVISDDDFIKPEDITFTRMSSINDLLNQEQTMEQYSLSIMQHFLDKYNGNVLQAAGKLDIGKSTIYRFISEGKLIVKRN